LRRHYFERSVGHDRDPKGRNFRAHHSKNNGAKVLKRFLKKKSDGPRIKFSAVDYVAEACLLYPWTPDTCLKMDARLFFAMMRRGRVLKYKQDSRKYFELLRVANHPHVTKESQDLVRQYYWDASLTEMQFQAREEKIAQIKEDAARHYAPNNSVLAFFAQGHRKGHA
jgi:hypothetical protein